MSLRLGLPLEEGHSVRRVKENKCKQLRLQETSEILTLRLCNATLHTNIFFMRCFGAAFLFVLVLNAAQIIIDTRREANVVKPSQTHKREKSRICKQGETDDRWHWGPRPSGILSIYEGMWRQILCRIWTFPKENPRLTDPFSQTLSRPSLEKPSDSMIKCSSTELSLWKDFRDKPRGTTLSFSR